jgi:hypothetical protein
VLQSEDAGPGWVLLLARLPASPSGPRVALWRRARAAGAAGLQNEARVLPPHRRARGVVGQLAETVRGQGGSAFVLAVPAANAGVDAEIAARFGADRTREYTEFAARPDGLLAEIGTETGGKFTFAELEEIEQDLDKLAGWLDKIGGRDFFPGQDRERAGPALPRGGGQGSPRRCMRPRAWGHPGSRRPGRAGRLMLPPLTAGVRGERGRLRFCLPSEPGPVRRPAAR